MNNRTIVNERIRREIIGPGSDLFVCKPDFSNEIIGGKPLQRYFSGILFPKERQEDGSDTGQDTFSDDVETPEDQEVPPIQTTDEGQQEEPDIKPGNDDDDEDTALKYRSNAFYPSHFGLSFCLEKRCEIVDLIISFGNYKKANYEDILLPYDGEGVELLKNFDQFIIYDSSAKAFRVIRELKLKENGQRTSDYQKLIESLNTLSKDFPNHALKPYIQKCLFGTKYRRFHNEVKVPIKIQNVLALAENHMSLLVSRQSGIDTTHWHKDLVDNLVLHVYVHGPRSEKYFLRVVLENKYPHKKDQFSLSKEKLNALALFQTEIRIESKHLLPFRDYRTHLYKTEEDTMLDYLYRNKLAYGIGHSTSCTWEYCEDDSKKPTWIKTTFLPEYNVRSQSTQTSKIPNSVLSIRSLSSLTDGKIKKQEILNNLWVVPKAYSQWILDEEQSANNDAHGLQNIEKCRRILSRIELGIQLLSENDNAFKAFQLANTAIYLQMFQGEWHFANKKDGYEIFERVDTPQRSYGDYATAEFPNNKSQPGWRPFQLAFILQSIPSFVDENSSDRELVDLLYFPTGGGKTEAYLAVSAFLIFWRRLQYPNEYDGVNVIIRYTLRLLSAQQFERATKLILACEFIRQHHKELGEKKISIGFWIGDATIPNRIEIAKTKLKKLLEKLNRSNFDGKNSINPFQLTNCQWCNSKLISRIKNDDRVYLVGHRINRNLDSYCLNPKCHFNEKHGGFPIVLIDDDIYRKPPTVLFGTVDKFAQLAWNAKATNLFNSNGNRKPELIIQDELHLLNGPLGSLVGLFENVVIALCTTEIQKPKIIASTATVKNVAEQIKGLYGRTASIFPQHATGPDDSFFSQTLSRSTRRYIGILPTGKTTVMTNLRLVAALLYARLEIWIQSLDKRNADEFWTLLSYFKSLKELGRFSNKITTELSTVIQQVQERYLRNQLPFSYNYWKLPYRNIELTSRIPNEYIKKNLDRLEIFFDGNLKEHKAYDLVLATNMISVGLDVGRLGVMVMNGMPPNTAEYIQTSSRVARKNEGLVVTLFDPFNTRDLSYFEDFVQFHKTFYKQVEPLSVTPFAENALDKMLFTMMVAYFRHKYGHAENNMAKALLQGDLKKKLREDLKQLFVNHPIAKNELVVISAKINRLIMDWEYKIQQSAKLFYKLEYEDKEKKRLLIPIEERKSEDEVRVAMRSMRNVEPNAEILIKPN